MVKKCIYALVDCNNFYASCERVFQPHLNGKPVVVLSNNDGCVVARSEESKALGIPMAVPVFKIKNLIEKHSVNVFSSNYALYGDMSQRVMQTLREFSPDVEVYSIDEAFLNLRGFDGIDLTEYGKTLRSKVLQWTGLPVSVGIAPTKVLSKVANYHAKRSKKAGGVLNLCDASWLDIALERTPVAKLWGVGPAYAKLFRRYGITTARHLRDADADWVRRKTSVMGERLVRELRGEACMPLELITPKQKNIHRSRSFGARVTELCDIREATASYLVRATEKLRSQGLCAQFVTVYLRTNPFRQSEPQYSNSATVGLPYPTDNTAELLSHALPAIERIFRKGFRYKKTGAMLSGLVSADSVQGNLFIGAGRDRAASAMRAVDRLNRRMGAGTLSFGSEGIRQRWKMKREKLSPAYTTRWHELASVRA